MSDYLILDRLKTGNALIDTLLVIILLPLITYFVNHVKTRVMEKTTYIIKPSHNSVTLEGSELYYYTKLYPTFPDALSAIYHYVTIRQLAKNVRLNTADNTYIIDNELGVPLTPTIFVDFRKEKDNVDDKSPNSISFKLQACIYSSVDPVKSITELIDSVVREHKQYINNKKSDILYHFVFKGVQNNLPIFSQTILYNPHDLKNSSTTAFDCLFSEHKQHLMQDVDKLGDIDYFHKTGTKRQRSYLFYGPPGTGKTCHVPALAKYSNRHIIEIPTSRLKKNSDLDMLFDLNHIDKIKFNYEDIIVHFDEIDQINGVLHKFAVSEEEDKLSIHYFQSMLDGIGTYPGLIITASTNNETFATEALGRCGRLTPIYFGQSRKEDIHEMIKFYTGQNLTAEQSALLPDRKLSYAEAKYLIERYTRFEELLEKIAEKSDPELTSSSLRIVK